MCCVEAIAQVGGIALLYPEENRGLTPMFTGIDKVRFRHPVKPGDQVRMEVDIVKIKGKMGKVEGRAYVGDKLCASGEYMFALYNRMRRIVVIVVGMENANPTSIVQP